jgi:broad specificity phosphatase PhoE
LAFSSPLGRAVETARLLIRGTDATLQQSELLIETDFDDWEGLNRSSLYEKPLWEQYTRNPFHFTFPGGESPQHVRERVLRFKRELMSRDDWKTALVVSHYTPLVFYVLMVLGHADGNRAPFKIENAAISVICTGEHGEHVKMLNYRP